MQRPCGARALACVVGCTCVLGAGFFIARWSMVGARIDLDPGVVDLGKVPVYDIVGGSIQLRNRGDLPLDFRLESGCACAELSRKAGRIPAGGSETVGVRVRLSKPGKKEFVSVVIRSNDAQNPTVVWRAIAECVERSEASTVPER